jgi:hypothetical protein
MHPEINITSGQPAPPTSLHELLAREESGA